MNIYGNVITDCEPTRNNRSDTGEKLQLLSHDRATYVAVNAPALRNGLRETLIALGAPINRRRIGARSTEAIKATMPRDMVERIENLEKKGNPAVFFQGVNDPNKWLDDKALGFMSANKTNKKKAKQETEAETEDTESSEPDESSNSVNKRNSAVFTNIAVSTVPYNYTTLFTQAPQTVSPESKEADRRSVLLRPQAALTAFQYPFGVHLEDWRDNPEGLQLIFQAFGQLSEVAGNQSNSCYDFSPASLVLRVTPDTASRIQYSFRTSGEPFTATYKVTAPEVVGKILTNALPGSEFWMAGQVVQSMDASTKEALVGQGVHLFEYCELMLQSIIKQLPTLIQG